MCALLELSTIGSQYRSVHDFPGTMKVADPVVIDFSTPDEKEFVGSRCTIVLNYGESVPCVTVRESFELSRI